ncbi:hypothetical protein HUB94_14515 [Paenibacillus cellulosilyticus]|nr:hypothetical protein [Paenibacillus cellulosilyticus]QKS45505.1 hypothetical protein HUB94_14515 [Paenibacillus cellulosilyticus]
MLNLNSDTVLQEQTHAIIRQVVDVYSRYTDKWFIGLVVHGSAVKGGFIEGWSDIDFQLYVEDRAFKNNQLPLNLCMAIHQELSTINPYPYQYIQTRVFTPSNVRYGRLVPDTYKLVAGKLLLPEYTGEQLYLQAKSALNELVPNKALHTESLLEHGDDRLLKSVRAFCTVVWPALYQLLTIQTNEGIKVWGLTKAQAVECIPEHTSIGRQIHEFHEAVLNYASNKSSIHNALLVIETGMGFLQQVKYWWVNDEVES